MPGGKLEREIDQLMSDVERLTRRVNGLLVKEAAERGALVKELPDVTGADMTIETVKEIYWDAPKEVSLFLMLQNLHMLRNVANLVSFGAERSMDMGKLFNFKHGECGGAPVEAVVEDDTLYLQCTNERCKARWLMSGLKRV